MHHQPQIILYTGVLPIYSVTRVPELPHGENQQLVLHFTDQYSFISILSILHDVGSHGCHENLELDHCNMTNITGGRLLGSHCESINCDLNSTSNMISTH